MRTSWAFLLKTFLKNFSSSVFQMAPEITNGFIYDSMCDVYCPAITIIVAFTAVHPYEPNLPIPNKRFNKEPKIENLDRRLIE